MDEATGDGRQGSPVRSCAHVPSGTRRGKGWTRLQAARVRDSGHERLGVFGGVAAVLTLNAASTSRAWHGSGAPRNRDRLRVPEAAGVILRVTYGRYTITTDPRSLMDAFGVIDAESSVDNVANRYNTRPPNRPR